MASETILIADDDPQLRIVLGDRLKAEGYGVVEAENGEQALSLVGKNIPDLMLLDLRMPGTHGMEVLRRSLEIDRELPVIVLTAFGTVEQAVEAVKMGASDFLLKPCRADHLLMVLRKVLENRDLKNENRWLKQELDSRFEMIVGSSPAMIKVMDMAARVAGKKTTVLIEGESGTGKQLLARAIHKLGDRSDKPFVQVNCTTLSEQLIESDLFGHEKGSFTGAVKQKRGRFEVADGGTLFLDEIGDLSAVIQAKLLHVLEYNEFQRVGGLDTLSADVRIIAATNRDLQQRVKDGHFREDLFYRLNVVTLYLPPLRERRDDVLVLADHFLKKHSIATGKDIRGFAPDALETLKTYPWPGNIRELENLIERAVVLAPGGKITRNLLIPVSGQTGAPPIETGLSLEEALLQFKKEFIIRTLEHTGYNQTRAADILRIQRTYLNRLIRDLQIGTES